MAAFKERQVLIVFSSHSAKHGFANSGILSSAGSSGRTEAVPLARRVTASAYMAEGGGGGVSTQYEVVLWS